MSEHHLFKPHKSIKYTIHLSIINLQQSSDKSFKGTQNFEFFIPVNNKSFQVLHLNKNTVLGFISDISDIQEYHDQIN